MENQVHTLAYRPVLPEEWGNMAKLFEEMGTNKGCWCMWWRLKRKEFDRNYGERNRTAMKAIVESGRVPGILAFLDDEPIGWCSIAPRKHFPVLDRSPVLKRVDDQPVWSINCFVIGNSFQGQGLMSKLIDAALSYARENGATIVEAYPLIPEASKNPDLQAYTGVISVFENMGFVEVARRSKIRPIMRYTFDGSESA
jgi:GNAT superfamily N-acetyltransferase